MSSDTTEKTSNVKLEKLLDDGSSNNYGGCEVKWKAKLSAYKLWKYIAEPKPESLNIKLKEDVRHRGVKEGTTEEVIFLKKGNREVWEKAQKDNEPWLDGNRLALSAIVEALPDHKLYLVKDIDYAADAWNAIREEYKPMNARTIVLAKQELLGTKCPSHSSADVQKWITYMIMQRQALQDADSNAFGDEEFARHLIMLGPSGGDWTYTSTDLAKALLSGELNGKKITSQAVINAYKEQMALNDRKAKEESVMNTNANGQRGEKRFSDTDYNGGRGNYPDPKRQRIEYNGPSFHSSQLRESIPQYRHMPGPSRGTLWCSNQFCRRQKGHSIEDCFVYGGGKAGQYPPWWMGPWNLHLHPSQRVSSQAPRGNPNGRNGQPRVYFTDFANNGQTLSNQVYYPPPNIPYPVANNPYQPPPSSYPPPPASYPPPLPTSSPDLSGDSTPHINNVVGPERMFIVNGQYIADIGDVQDLSESVNKLALTGKDQDDDVLWDTGATKGVFHDRAVFKEYTPLVPPVQVNAFGSHLATIAVAIGSVELESFIDDQHTDRFVLTRVLHIPDARCNLVSGIQLDRKGVFATTGNGKVALYTRGSSVPFAVGEIVNDLYKLKVRPVIYNSAADLPPRVSLASASEDPLNAPGRRSRSAPEIGDQVPNTAVQPLDPGVFAVPSLTSLYEPPTEEDKIKSFGTV
jgi:hypothetical protein